LRCSEPTRSGFEEIYGSRVEAVTAYAEAWRRRRLWSVVAQTFLVCCHRHDRVPENALPGP
jgi:hypothetical protein